jgi:hypothetical protein
MASSFPGGLDSFTNPTATDTLDSATVPHADQHSNANDAIEAIEGTLGVNPQGSSATVVARLTALDSTVAGKAPASGISPSAITGTAVVTSDARLSDTRIPTDASVTDAKIATTLSPSKITGTAVVTADSRLSDNRIPTDASVTDAKIATAGLAQSSLNGVAIADWAASTSYAKGDLVNYQGVAYRRISAGTSGLTFVGTMWQQVTPSLSAVASNLPSASTTVVGVVQLEDSVSSTSTTKAATPNSVKTAYDLAAGALPLSGGTMSGAINMGANSLSNLYNLSLRYIGAGTTYVTLTAAGLYDTTLTLPTNSTGYATVATSGNVNTFTVGGQRIENDNGGVVPLTIQSATVQTLALLNLTSSAGTSVFNVSGSGTLLTSGNVNAGSTSATSAKISGISGAAGNIVSLFRGFGNQTANLVQLENIASVTVGGFNGAGQIFTGSTTPVLTAVGGTIQSITTGSTPTVTMASAHGLTANDIIVLASTTGGTYNGTYTVSSITSTTAFTITTSATTGQASAAGTVSITPQASITTRSVGTIGLIIRGVASQATNLQEWQNSSGTIVARVNGSGLVVAGAGFAAASSTNSFINGTATTVGGGVGVLAIGNVQTAPSSDPTGGGVLYSDTGSLRCRAPSTGGAGVIQPKFTAVVTSLKTHTATAQLEAVFAGAPGTTNGAITLKSDTWYEFRGQLIVNRASVVAPASGVMIGATFSQAPQTYALTGNGFNPASAAANAGSATASGDSFLVTNAATSTTGTALLVNFQGLMKTNATTGGTFTLQFAQGSAANTYNTGQCAVQAGSFIKVAELPATATGNWS